jgi:hypothetical protein
MASVHDVPPMHVVVRPNIKHADGRSFVSVYYMHAAERVSIGGRANDTVFT